MAQSYFDEYTKALRAGQKQYRDCLARGAYPYTPVLDEMVSDATVEHIAELGLVEIPSNLIVGTKTPGRTLAFASNFMPLLGSETEFAHKWVELCKAHLEEGIREPIICYEYLGKFYVLEGNKRVSVLKYFEAPRITGSVIRLVPGYTNDPVVQLYYEFIDFYKVTGLYGVNPSKPGAYAKLLAALGCQPEQVWTDEERQQFSARFAYFQEAFWQLGGDSLPITAADALLVWLRVFTMEDLKLQTSAEIRKNLAAMWDNVKAAGERAPVAVSTQPAGQEGLLNKIKQVTAPAKLKVAFVNERNPVDSNWTQGHELGRRQLEATFGDRVLTTVYNDAIPGVNGLEKLQQAIDEGADLIFATTPPLIGDCLKAMVKNPSARILNCSVDMPYPNLRTYYSRVYEGKFITGAIAGAMAKDDRIGYVGSYPIFGVPASINAFALGALLTNPRARIQLRWTCMPGHPLDDLTRKGVSVISNRDIPAPEQSSHTYGTLLVQPDGTMKELASPYWNWGRFYVNVVNSVLSGNWSSERSNKSQAVNYWWGMNSGVVDVLLSRDLPEGVAQLAEILRTGIIHGSIDPFRRRIVTQEGRQVSDGSRWLPPDEILHMDYLVENVDGKIPEFEELLPMSRAMVRLQGVYRDRIPPEKEAMV